MPKKIEVLQVEEDEVPFAVLATSIRDLSTLGKKIANSPLKLDAIILLLAEKSHVSRRDIRTILDMLPELEKMFLKPKKEKS